MTDGTPDPQARQQAHEKALDLVEDALDKIDDQPKEAGRLLDRAKSIDPAAAKQVLADLDEDAGSDHTPTVG